MGDTLAQDGFAMSEPFLGTQQFGAEVIEVDSTKVLEFAPFEQIPHPFLWIQLWSVARQLLQMDACGSPLCQEVFDHLRAMNARPIPDDQQFALDFAQQRVQETHHVRSFEGMILDVHDQAPIHREATDRGEMIAGEWHRQHGRLSHRSVGA